MEGTVHQRGGLLRPFGLGTFIRDYLSGKGTVYGPGVADPQRGAPIEEVKAAYKTTLIRAYAENFVAAAKEKGIELSIEEAILRTPQRTTSIRSHSFYSYFQHLKMLDWVESTGEEEDSLFGGMVGARVERTPEGTTIVEVPQPRRFYRLTTLGQEAPDYAWSDPVQALYDYPPEQRHRRKFYPKPGSLPRMPARAVLPTSRDVP